MRRLATVKGFWMYNQELIQNQSVWWIWWASGTVANVAASVLSTRWPHFTQHMLSVEPHSTLPQGHCRLWIAVLVLSIQALLFLRVILIWIWETRTVHISLSSFLSMWGPNYYIIRLCRVRMFDLKFSVWVTVFSFINKLWNEFWLLIRTEFPTISERVLNVPPASLS